MKAPLPQKTIIFLLTIMLCACGGSSSGDSDNENLNAGNTGGGAQVLEDMTGSDNPNNGDTDLSPGTAGISGNVVDAITGVALPDVEISVDGLSETALSRSDGQYELGSLPNNIPLDVRFSLDGYVSEVYRTPLLNPTPENTFNQLDTVALIPDDNTGTGGIGGTISDSQGNLLAGVVLRFLLGINTIEGIAVATTSTNSQGFWTISGLVAGNYTCIIEIEGQDPVFETVQIVGGIEDSNTNVAVPNITSPQIDFPPEGSRNDYAETEVEWSFSRFNYRASSGSYSVDQDDRTGTLRLLHFGDFAQNPFEYRDSVVIITHTFAGPGVYSVVPFASVKEEAAKVGQPAALATVSVNANGPMGTIGFDRLEDFSTSYDSESERGGSLTVTVDATTGRYVFSTSGLTLDKSRLQFLDSIHPDAPESIGFDLSNGNAP